MTTENASGSIRSLSPTGSDASTSSFKRPREEEADSDDVSRLRSGRPKTSKMNQAAVIESLNRISNTHEKHGELLNELPSVKQQLINQGELLKDIPAMKARLDSFCQDVAELKIQCNSISADNVNLKRDVAELKARIDNVSVQNSDNAPSMAQDLSRLAAATNSNAAHIQQILTRQSHIDEFIISGFSLELGRAYDLFALVSAVTKALKVELEPGDFINVRTMQKPQPTTASNQSDEGVNSANTTDITVRRTSIVVKCAKPNIVSKVLNAKRKHKALKLSHLNADEVTALNLPKAKNDYSIFVNELLPSHTFKLLGSARRTLKTHGFKFVWSKNGTIFAKFDEASVVHTVLTTEDLEKLRLLYHQRTA